MLIIDVIASDQSTNSAQLYSYSINLIRAIVLVSVAAGPTGARAKVRELDMLENPEYAMRYANVSPVF